MNHQQETTIVKTINTSNMIHTVIEDKETGTMKIKMLTHYTNKIDIIKGFNLLIVRIIN